MDKKAKIIATLGPAISSTTQLKKIIELGVDAFRINFSTIPKISKVLLIKLDIWKIKQKRG